MMHGWGNGFGDMGGMSPLGWVFMLLFWLLLIGGLIWFFVTLSRNQNSGRSSPSALNVLKERYARGEINREEFEQKKRDLE